MLREHPFMIKPERNIKLWRYMDFTKFIALLENKKLVFPSSNLFEDPFEGTWSKASLETLKINANLMQQVIT